MRLRTVRQVNQQHQQHKRRNNRKMEILSCKFNFWFMLRLSPISFVTLLKRLILDLAAKDLIRIPSSVSSKVSNFIFSALFAALHRNLLLLSANDVPATKSIVRLSAPEAESIVDYFLATMYGGQECYTMNGNMIESSMIPGSTVLSPSPTMMVQQHHPSDLYSNGGQNMIASLRTHSSKFPVSIHS
jgi:hypothetical protein